MKPSPCMILNKLVMSGGRGVTRVLRLLGSRTGWV